MCTVAGRCGFGLLVVSLSMLGCGGPESDTGDVSTAAFTEPTELVAEAASHSEIVERGRYIVEGPGICLYCHSEIDWSSPGFPIVEGRKGAGAIFPDVSVPGRVVSSNITPDPETGIGGWSDAELATAIREGIGRDGRRLFPVMPYLFYRNMSDDDVEAVIAYLRTLEPVYNVLPPTEIPQPVMESLPPHVPITEPVVAPPRSDRVAYGAYLANLSHCVECHTPVTPQGEPIMELAFSGGRKLEGPWGVVASANITSDPSGIPHYDEAHFIETLRTCRYGARDLNHLMPCTFFKNMTEEDLGALFAFIQTLPPVRHRVSNTDPPTACRLCGQEHGLGDSN